MMRVRALPLMMPCSKGRLSYVECLQPLLCTLCGASGAVPTLSAISDPRVHSSVAVCLEGSHPERFGDYISMRFENDPQKFHLDLPCPKCRHFVRALIEAGPIYKI